MCLLSIGTDPSDNILALAKQRDKGIPFEYNIKINKIQNTLFNRV
jgi:hypothetical protein